MSDLFIFIGPVLIDCRPVAWNAAIAAVYAVAAVVGGVVASKVWKKNEHIHFAAWITLTVGSSPRLPSSGLANVFVAVRLLQAILGFASGAIAKGSGNPALAISETSRSLTFLWDFGQFAIINALLRALTTCVLSHQTFAKRVYNWVPTAVFPQLLLGYILSGVAEHAMTDGMAVLVSFRVMRAARTLLQIAMIIEGLTILFLAFGFAVVLSRRRAGGRAPDVPAFSTAAAAIPILVALLVRNVGDQLRQWTLRQPSLGELIGAGLLPEAIAVAAWIGLSFRIWRWERRQPKTLGGNDSEGGVVWQPDTQHHHIPVQQQVHYQQPVHYQPPVQQPVQYQYPAQHPGVYQPGVYQPGTYPPNTYQPGVYQT